MSGALYYPNWSINSPLDFAEFLLFWDRLTLLTPDDDWIFSVYSKDKTIEKALNEAHEKYAIPHKPTKKEKKRCQKLIKYLIDNKEVEFKKYSDIVGQKPYQLSANKLDQETVRMLSEKRVFEHHYDEYYLADNAAGHIVMASLAHSCSSDGLPAVTEDNNQFKLQMRTISDVLNIENKEEDVGLEEKENAISIIVKKVKLLGIGTENPNNLKKVLIAREKDDVNGLRENFQEKIMSYKTRIQNCETMPELNDILKEFDEKIESDKKLLLKELKLAGVDAVISKDGVIALAVGGIVGLASIGLGVAAGAAVELRAYQNARKDVLKDHWTSWLYKTKHPRFSVW